MIDFSEIEKKITDGMSISHIESRLKPKCSYISSTSWNDYSKEGFLAKGEKLLDVVKKDYDTLQRIGKSYEDLAKIAFDVIKQNSIDFANHHADIFTKVQNFLFQKPVVKIDKKKFQSTHFASFGHQSCPWGCEHGQDEFGYNTIGGSHIVINEKTAHGLIACTTITDLTPHLMASHYFCQGNTIYRTDPEKLLQIAEK